MAETTTISQNEPAMPTEDPRVAALAEVFGDQFAYNFRDPVIFVTETLRSPSPLSFYRRDFKLLSRYLFLESVYRRRPDYNQEMLDKYARMTGEKLAAVTLLLTKRIEQTAAMFKSNGINPDAVYLQPQTFYIPIIAMHARSFIGLLVKLDEYYQMTGSAALYGIIDGGQRMRAELEGRRAVRSFTAMVRMEQIKLRKESWRLRDAMGGVVAPDIAYAENSVNDAQVDFDKTAVEDKDGNVEMHEAEGVLDEIVSTGMAAANAATRKKSTKAKDESHTTGATGDLLSTAASPT